MQRVFLATVLLIMFSSASWSRELIDQLGRKVDVTQPLTRVVSLAPSLTEIAYEVGGGGALVGATQFATFPDAAQKLPRVGSYVSLDIEKIIRLQPELCLATKDGNSKESVEHLEKLGIPVYVFDPKSLEDILDTMTRLGIIFNTSQKTSMLVSKYQQRLTHIDRQLEKIKNRPRVFFQIDAHPIFSAGKDTFIHRLLTRAGTVNLAAGRSGYPRYVWEELLTLKPDVVLLASMGGGYSHEELRSMWQAWPQIPAVKNERLYVIDADLFDRPTPRLIAALEYLVSLLHPELQM